MCKKTKAYNRINKFDSVTNNLNYLIKRLISKISILLLGLLLFISCADELPRQIVPFAPVNVQIDLDGLDHSLKNPLSYKVFTEQDRRTDDDHFGYGGVLVTSDVTGTILYAYDLCCPFEKKRDIKIVPEEDGTATCPTCGTAFVTMYGFGTPEKGVSKEPLQRYRVFSIASGVYRVVN